MSFQMDYEVLETKALVLASMMFFYYRGKWASHSQSDSLLLLLYYESFPLSHIIPTGKFYSTSAEFLQQWSRFSPSSFLTELLTYAISAPLFPNLYPKTGFHHHHSFTRSLTISMLSSPVDIFLSS